MNAIDTNILIYAISGDEPAKRSIAAALLDRVNASDTVLLWQVACEVGAVVERLRRRNMIESEELDFVRALCDRFTLVLPTAEVLNAGLDLHRTQQVSYWDAMLLAACAEAGVTRLYSEDVQSRPVISGIEIVNPFREV